MKALGFQVKSTMHCENLIVKSFEMYVSKTCSKTVVESLIMVELFEVYRQLKFSSSLYLSFLFIFIHTPAHVPPQLLQM